MPGPQHGRTLTAPLIGIATLAAFTALATLCVRSAVPGIEAKVLSGVETTLLEQAPTTAAQVSVSVSGRDVILKGSVPDAQLAQELIALAGSVEGVRGVSTQLDGATDLAPSAPLVAATTEDAPPISTTLPGEAVRIEPIAADAPSPATGASSGEPPVASSMADTPGLDSEIASGRDTETVSEASPNALANASADADTPAIASTGRAASLRISFEGNALTLDGELASQTEIDALADQALLSENVHYLSSTVATADDVATSNWVSEVAPLLAQLEGLERVQLRIKDNTLHLSGAAQSSNEASRFIAAASAVDGFRLSGGLGIETSSAQAAGTGNTALVEQAAQSTAAPPSIQPQALAQQRSSPADDSKGRDGVPDTAETNANQLAPNTPVTSTRASTDPADSLREDFQRLEDTRIQFESSSARLTGNSRRVVANIAAVLNRHPDVAVRIGGHTDNTGDAQANLILSQERANAVRDELTRLGVSPYRLSSSGYGESLPISSNDTEAGKQANRRIEFIF